MNKSIVGKWRVFDSNRPLVSDENSNSIGSFGIFLENGVHFMILKEGQRFKLHYRYDEGFGALDLVFSDGDKSFLVQMLPGDQRKMVVTERDNDYFDSYEYVGPPVY
jgi:hypothetical protein